MFTHLSSRGKRKKALPAKLIKLHKALTKHLECQERLSERLMDINLRGLSSDVLLGALRDIDKALEELK